MDSAGMYKMLSSYQHLGTTAWRSIGASWEKASIHDAWSLIHWFLIDVPVIPFLITFHVLFAAISTYKGGASRHFWLKSLVLTLFAAFGGSTLSSILSGAPPPLFTMGSNYMFGYVAAAWYVVNMVAPIRMLLMFRPVAAVLAFGAQAAKARSIFGFIDGFILRYPRSAVGAIVLGGLAGSGGTLILGFERKLRMGKASHSEFSRPGWTFKSAYLASTLYYMLTDQDSFLRDLFGWNIVIAKDRARFWIALALCCHAAIEALWGKHINPLYIFETAFYLVMRLDSSDVVEQKQAASPPYKAASKPSKAGNAAGNAARDRTVGNGRPRPSGNSGNTGNGNGSSRKGTANSAPLRQRKSRAT